MRSITGKTKKVGIIGWPLGHAASPRIHNAAFAALGLDFIYLYLPVAPENIAGAVAGLKTLGFDGANVTIPHKVAIMPFLDELDESAKLAGAVNTIVIKNGNSVGYNTDFSGFIQSLRLAKVDIAGKKTVIFGAGGACRAVAAAFVRHGADAVAILARDSSKAAATAGLFSSFGFAPLSGYGWDEAACLDVSAQADILVNSTPLGMSPNCDAMPPVRWDVINPAAVFVDLIYNPRVTMLLKEAMARGHKTINGEGMLIEQAAAAFMLWTGQEAPREVMYRAF